MNKQEIKNRMNQLINEESSNNKKIKELRSSGQMGVGFEIQDLKWRNEEISKEYTKLQSKLFWL
jgi:hypothetical protein